MKRKHFILALVAMLWSFSFSAYADDVIVVNSWAELKAALEASDEVQRSAARQRSTVMRTVSTASEETTEEETKTPIPNTPYYYEDFQTTKIQLGKNVVYDDALPISKSSGTTLDLNGYTVSGSESAEHAYPFYNYGKFLVVDNSEAGTGALYCGVKTGIKEDGVSINEEAVFVMTGGNIICTHDNEEDAAVVNYGIAYITGGTIEGANNAVLNQEGATMHILAGVLISGDVEGTGINAAEGVYTVAQIGTTKYGTLQAAINAAVDGDVITLVTDASGNVTVTQAPDVKFTIDGNDKKFTGTITVDGKSARYETAGLTIKNVNFDATGIDNTVYDACVRLGDGTNATRYTNNVTVENCTFTDNDYSTVAIKSYTGGDKNLQVLACEATGMHSLLQVANVEEGLVIRGNKVEADGGINLNSSAGVVVENNVMTVKSYAVRIGAGSGGGSGEITLADNTLKSDCEGGDAVIIVRGAAVTEVDLTMTENVVSGTTHISGNTADTKIAADANYWDGDSAPRVVDTPISVNSYYTDEALSNLVRNQTGSINAFVYAATGRISGDVTSNAAESLLINIYGEDGTIIGTTSLENETHLIGTPKLLTWRISLGADDSDSWAMAWNEGAPSVNNMPAKVKLVVDDKEVAEADIKFTAGGDGVSPVFAAKTDADGKILSFIACEGEFNLNNANAKLAEVATAAATGDIITLIADGEYTLPVFAGKELTFKGINKEGVIINDAPDARTQGWNGSTIHFENLTAKGATANYHGLANGVVAVTYTDCNIEGLRFLYANEVSFDGCTFNAVGVEHSFWTYGASNVTVKNSTFTYTDRAVNCYSESGAKHETDITFEGCSFTYAGTAAEPAGAVEINSGSIKSIDVDFTENCVAPEKGAMWFISQWDSKMGDNTIVKVNDEIVWTRQPRGGQIIGYTSDVAIYGETSSNAAESYVVKVVDANGNVMGTTSLNDVDNIIDGTEKPITWTLKLDAASNTDPYWTMSWETAPTITNMPAKVQLWVDGVMVSESNIKLNRPDDANPVFAAKTDADGKILSFIACDGYNLSTAADKLVSASAAGDNIAILIAGTYKVPTGKDLTITGAVEGVVFDNIGACGMGGANVTFNNVTFDYYPNADYTGLQAAGKMVYNNCTINGQVFLYGQSETFNKCTFNQESADAYNVWTYSAKDVAFNECTFNSAGKSVLVYNEGAGATDLVVNETEFNASAAVEGKAAIEIDTHLMPGQTTITVDAETTVTGFDAGSVSGNSLWNNKKGNADDANNDITVVVNGETVLQPIYTAQIGDKSYRTLQGAIDAVKNGEEIVLVDDCAEAVSFTQTKEVSFVLNGNEKTMTGSINITARAGKDATSTLVIKNFNFKTDETAYDFIKSVETNYYPNNITIQDCTFEGTSDINAEGYAVVAVRLKSANNITIKDCTGTGLHSFLQNTAGWNVTIDNVDITNSLSGFAMGTVQGTTIKNCDIVAQASGIRLDAQYNNNAVIADNKIEAFIPVVVRKASVDGTLTFNGTNDFTQNNTDGYWCVIGTSEYVANGALPTAATGKVSVTLAGEGLDPAGIYGSFGVASINRDGKVVNYLSLAEALDAALDGETVNLHWTAGDAPISMSGTVCGNKTVTITGTAEVDWSKGWFYVGRNGEGNGKVIFDNAKLTSTEASLTNGTYGINVSMAEYGKATTNDGEVVFKNSNIDLSVLIGKNNVTVDGGNLTVWYGFAVGARPASETNNVERTVTMNIVNGAKVVVKNHNGQGLGYEALGVMNIDATSTFETTQAFLVTAKGTMNVNGKASVAGTLTNNGTINLTAKDATLATPTAGLTVNTDVADYKVAYIDGVYQLVEKDYIAQVGDQKFEVFTDALNAVENGGTITLLGGAFDESGKEIDFEEAITFTITGQAPEAKLPIVTFQNATVNIKDANFQIPELDARQNATINVVNSTVYDAGGDGIVKSYYNGAINIDKTSTVYTMQVTTMGYINVAGTLNATWQTNVYGNGMITLSEGATFNTAALQLTGKDYSGRDNTDADRVGKPATIVVDGANFTVGKVLSSSGADYSYHSSYGINVGTIDGKSAILDIKNGANVNIYMADGQTANIGADGTVNVDASTLNVAVRGEGSVTLANAGTVNVSGEANLAANVTGNGWFYMNGVSLDADTKLLGAKVRFASGTNTVDGATIDDGFFQVGIGAYNGVDANVDTENGVVVNVKNNAKIGSNGSTYAGWVGTGFYETDAEKAAVMTEAKYVLNIDNSIAEFGYLHVSNDGELNVNGVPANKAHYNNSDYAFRAGDFIINGTANFTGTDVLAFYTKVSCDNGTDKPGTLNINAGTEYEAERHNGAIAGTNFILYKTGVANVAVGATLHIGEPSSIAADAALNIAGTATALGTITNNGAINFTNDAATLTTPTTDLTLGYNLNADKKVVYADGAYKVVSKVYVAQVGDVKYESLQEAIENVADNGTVTLLSDVTVTEAAHGQNALNHARAINFTLDLNGKTLSANTGNSVFRFNIAGSGATSDVTVTVKNGTVVSGADTWCALMASGISADAKAVMNLVDLTIENYKGGDFAVKAWDNGVVNAKNVKINASYGGGFYALGGEIVLDDCTVEQKGLWTAPYNSMTIGVSNGGKMTVNSGTYSAVPVAAADGYNQGTSHGSWCGGVMSSGGTLIINGGTFSNGNIGGTASNPRELFIVGADADCGDNVAARLEINGGTFNSIGALTHCETIWGSENDAANTYMPTMDVVITDGDFTGVAGKVIGGCDPISTGNPVGIAISGGVYTAATHALDNSYLADGYVIAKLDDTTDTVVEATVKVNDTYYATLAAGLKALTDDATLTLVKDITVAELWDCRKNGAKVTAANVTIDGNGKTLKIEGEVEDKNWNAVFRFEGDNATVKNLTIDASAATGIVRGITAKLSITVDNCTIIGNGTTAKRAIIFGEGAGDALANVEATVTNSTFRNWTLGVSDNQSGKDAKNVTVSGNIFENASVHVSASENVTFDKNTLVGGYVNITSYTNEAGLSVHATENELDTEQVNKITVNPSGIYAQGGFSIPVAEVGGAYYLTLAGAISKANGATVTVLDDIILSEAVEVTTAAVLNLNDNSITPTTDATMTGGLFRLLEGADLTITGKGEISNNGNANVYAAVSVLGNNAKLTVNGGNLTGYYYGIAGNGYREGTQVTIKGGEIASIEATGAGIYHPQNGTLTVTDGTITGATGIYFKGGDLAISGGTVKGTGTEADYVYSGNGFNATGDALVIENVAKDGYEAIGTVSITGGTFISDNAAPIASYAPEFSTAKGEFLGAESVAAKFNNDNIDESLLAVRYQLMDEDGDGFYGVKYTNHREHLTIVDGTYTEFVNEAELSVGTLTYERKLAAGIWNPLYVPFEIPVEALTALGYEAAFFYDVHFEVGAGGVINPDSNPEVHLIKIKSGTLRANYPYVIRPSEDADLNLSLVLENTTLFTTAEDKMNSVESGSTINRFIFTGTYKRANPEGLTGDADVPCYVITSAGTFNKMKPTAYLSPFRVYMSIIAKDGSPVIMTGEAAESIKMRAIGEENEDGTTTIYDVEADELTVDYIYDLQGRRVLEPQKGGLYIVNGKKVIF